MARDIFHDIVKDALIKEDWIITDDPLTLLSRAEGGISTDLGAEKIIVAEKGLTKIAVEVKSFINPSMIHDFLRASGQYNGYNIVIKYKHIERVLYLAMPIFAYEKLITYDFVNAIIENVSIKFILFDEQEKTIVKWIE
jgi:XisH protein